MPVLAPRRQREWVYRSVIAYDHNPEGVSMIRSRTRVANVAGWRNFSVAIDDLVVWHK